MIFGNQSQRKQQQRQPAIKPKKILTNALIFVSTTAPMSTSIPFPVDEIPARHLKQNINDLDFNDPATFRPRADGIHVNVILQHATLVGWLTKHRTPTFSFMKNIKRRYVVLVDRMLYTFKAEKADTYREFLELTPNTNAFVTDQFSGVLFCIEIKKKGVDESWFLQADDAESMKLWLDRIKRTISWLRAGYTGTITKSSLSQIITEEEEYSLVAASVRKQGIYQSAESSKSNTSIESGSSSSIVFPLPPTSQPSSPTSFIPQQYENGSVTSFQSSADFSASEYSVDTPRRHSSLRMTRPSLISVSSLPTVLPPQLPPPKSQLPPIPSSYASYL